VPEEDEIVGDRGAMHETVVGNCDGWWCMGPVMSGTWMGDKSSDGGEELGMEGGCWAEERYGKMVSSKTT
jgi:hypothetical protein